ncbi:MAG: hypothetical protein KAI24_02410 [Planctomycetes bacterium]|nr:hypothetical protein [Planctomycetota bacterium]
MRAAVALLLSAAGCAAPPAVGAPDAPDGRSWRTVTVWFEPALAERGTLTVVHESGYRWRGVTASTSVSFDVPEGPCTLTLECGPRSGERVWKVAATDREFVWRAGGR